jgi:hypothetical protein
MNSDGNFMNAVLFRLACLFLPLMCFLSAASSVSADTYSQTLQGPYKGRVISADDVVLSGDSNELHLELKNLSSTSISLDIQIDSSGSDRRKTSRALQSGFINPGSVYSIPLLSFEAAGLFSITPKCKTPLREEAQKEEDCAAQSVYELSVRDINSAEGDVFLLLSLAPEEGTAAKQTVSEIDTPALPTRETFSQRGRERLSQYIQTARTASHSAVSRVKSWFSDGSEGGEDGSGAEGAAWPSETRSSVRAEAGKNEERSDYQSNVPDVSDEGMQDHSNTPHGIQSVSSRSMPRSGNGPFVDISSAFSVVFSNQSSNLNRATRILSSRADVRVRNTSGEAVPLPVHLVVATDPASSDIVLEGASGGVGQAPYNTFFISLGTSGGSLQPGEHLDSVLNFSRPSRVILPFLQKFLEKARRRKIPSLSSHMQTRARTELSCYFPVKRLCHFYWMEGILQIPLAGTLSISGAGHKTHSQEPAPRFSFRRVRILFLS